MSPFMVGETAFNALGRLRVNSMTWSCGMATLISFECEGGCRAADEEILLAPMSSWVRWVDGVGKNGWESVTYGPRVAGTRLRSRDTGTGTRSAISITLRGNHKDRPRSRLQLYFDQRTMYPFRLQRGNTRDGNREESCTQLGANELRNLHAYALKRKHEQYALHSQGLSR